MTDPTDIHAQLTALRSEIKQTPPTTAAAAPPADSAPPPEATPPEAWSREQIEQALAELRTTVTELTSEAEDAIAENPLLAIGAAFLLGVVAGRLSKRV